MLLWENERRKFLDFIFCCTKFKVKCFSYCLFNFNCNPKSNIHISSWKIKTVCRAFEIFELDKPRVQVNESNPIIYQISHKEVMEEETEHAYIYIKIHEVFIFSERAKHFLHSWHVEIAREYILRHVQRWSSDIFVCITWVSIIFIIFLLFREIAIVFSLFCWFWMRMRILSHIELISSSFISFLFFLDWNKVGHTHAYVHNTQMKANVAYT